MYFISLEYKAIKSKVIYLLFQSTNVLGTFVFAGLLLRVGDYAW